MTTFAHKKLNGEIVKKFLNAIQEEESTTLEWKNGPYIRNANIRTTRITHWPGNDTIMLQGPEAETKELNEKNLKKYCLKEQRKGEQAPTAMKRNATS